MSEFQNRAVELFNARPGSGPLSSAEFRFQMLKASLALYRAAGGSESVAQNLFEEGFSGTQEDAARSVGELMMAVAGVSHLHDMDMMQAAYNALDRGFRQLSPVTSAAASR